MAVLAFLPALKDGVSREVPDDLLCFPVGFRSYKSNRPLTGP